jgi:competence protein CoiA
MHYEEDFEISTSKTTAKRVADNKLVHASEVTKKDGPFYCDETFEELIVRKCIEKIDHFAYKARMSPIAKRQSELHTECQNELLELLQRTFPNGKWEAERQNFTENKEKGYKKVVPDLSGKINNKGVIIEIQKSTLSVKKILHRTEQYSKRGGYILWIVPLTEQLGSENFRPRLFERFLHTMYYGRVYYWHKGNGTKLIPVHFGTAERWIQETTWFDENGEEQTAGGYDKPFLRVKKPEFGKTIDLTTDFKFDDRKAFELENDKLSAPKSKIFMDKNKVWWK